MRIRESADVPIDVTSEWLGLRDKLADLPPAERQAWAIELAARLVEEAAYLTADDQALPVVTRLMSWSHDLSRMSRAFREAA
jgi:hypothetical protein